MRFIERSASRPGVAAAAAAHLAAGGILVHPTSGVYGIGGRPDPELDREVARVKGRADGPGFVRLVADVDGLRRAFPAVRWTPLAARLAEVFWPGPLTLVLEDGSEYGVAVRVESHPLTRTILRRFAAPLGSTSVNRAGERPAADPSSVREVLRAFPASDRPVMFVDAGALPGPPPSTLVRVPGTGGRNFDVLRRGAIEPARIAAAVGSGDGETSA